MIMNSIEYNIYNIETTIAYLAFTFWHNTVQIINNTHPINGKLPHPRIVIAINIP